MLLEISNAQWAIKRIFLNARRRLRLASYYTRRLKTWKLRAQELVRLSMVLKEKFKLLEEGLVGSYTTTRSSKAQNLKIRARSSSTSKFQSDCQRPATEITSTQMIIGFFLTGWLILLARLEHEPKLINWVSSKYWRFKNGTRPPLRAETWLSIDILISVGQT